MQASLSKNDAPDGSLVILEVILPGKAGQIHAQYEGIELPFYPIGESSSGKYQAVVPVPYNRAPGPTQVKVSWEDGTHRESLELPLQVVSGNYRSETLTMDSKYVSPPKKVLSRITRERAEVGALYTQVTAEKLWNGKFLLPADSEISSPYGSKRLLNGKMQSFHQGLDLRAKVGTPIRAPAGGKVVLAKDLYYTGNTVILDHGYGVFTLYAHLSKLKVKRGQIVKSEALLGLSGATGRATGPHLHWGAVVHKQKVNPLDLTQVMQ